MFCKNLQAHILCGRKGLKKSFCGNKTSNNKKRYNK